MPHYPQQQHHSLHHSTDRRKHLNLLLFDQLEEINRMYAGTGRLPTYTLGPLHAATMRTQTAPAGDQLGGRERFTRMFLEKKPQPSEFSNASHPLSQTALRAMHTGRLTPELHFNAQDPSTSGLDEPWQGASQLLEPCAATTAPGTYQQQPPAQTAAAATLPSITGTKAHAPWLMPWQTGDRETGRRWADLIRKKRTPIGAFANLDLAKAAK